MAPGQRWYCSCGARYATKFGVVCEFVYSPTDVRYCKAEVPDDMFKDVKFMSVEQANSNCKTPEELFNAIPTVKPLDRGAFLTETHVKGHYKFDKTMFDSLGEPLKWAQLFASLFTNGQK